MPLGAEDCLAKGCQPTKWRAPNTASKHTNADGYTSIKGSSSSLSREQLHLPTKQPTNQPTAKWRKFVCVCCLCHLDRYTFANIGGTNGCRLDSHRVCFAVCLSESECECLWCVCVCTLPLITQYSTARRENNALVRLDGRTRLIR